MANITLGDESRKNEITLLCSHDKEVKLDVKLAPLLITIKDMLQEDNDKNNTIPLPNISKDVMEKVIEFATQHKDCILSEDYKEVPKDLEPFKDEWNANFVNSMSSDLIFGVVLAANDLNFKHLIDIACKGVALRMEGKTPDELKRTFRSA